MDLRKEYLQGWHKASVCPLSGLRANLENKMAWPFSGKVTLGSVPSMREGARGGRAYWALQFSYNLFNSSTLYISTPKHFLILDFVLHSCISEQGWWLILTAYWPVMGRGTRLSASTPPTSIPTHNSPAPMKTTRSWGQEQNLELFPTWRLQMLLTHIPIPSPSHSTASCMGVHLWNHCVTTRKSKR